MRELGVPAAGHGATQNILLDSRRLKAPHIFISLGNIAGLWESCQLCVQTFIQLGRKSVLARCAAQWIEK
jgi:hypothetical protein